jgi:hypothetical protein
MVSVRFVIAGMAVCIVAGCRTAAESARPPSRRQPTTAPTNSPSPTAAGSAAELHALIAKHGSVTFRSFGGKWVGTDGDTDLTFLPGGAAHMFEYGVGVTGYHGTYAIDPRGNVTVQLPTFGHAWPVMSLRKEATSLLLVPAQDQDGFVMGNRGGATFARGRGTYWPFRPLNPAEGARVVGRIRG